MSNVQNTVESNEEILREMRNKFANLASVTIANGDWRAIMEAGALASLKVSRYRGVKSLTSADLGLDAQEMRDVESIVNLGHRLLLPQEILNAFNTLETRARQVVRSSGLLTPLGLFVPARNYDELANTMAIFKGKFDELVSNLIYDLPQHRERMVREYERLAQQVLNRILNADPYAVSYADRDRWLDEFTDRCMSHFPSEESLRSSFAFALSLQFVPLPYETQNEIPEFASASADLVNMRRAVLREQQETRSALVNEFLGSVQNELYSLINEALSDTLASLRKNESLNSRSVVQLKNVVKSISDLNFWGDRRIETIRDEIQALLDRPSKTRSAALATSVLEELSYQARAANIDLQSLRDDPIIPPSVTSSLDLKPIAQRVALAPAMEEYMSGSAPAQEGYDKLASANQWPAAQQESDLVWYGPTGEYITQDESNKRSRQALAAMGIEFTDPAPAAQRDDPVIAFVPPSAKRAPARKLF
jgi:hypothetical protein